MELTDKQRAILRIQGHMLVTGGPGSGKTTIAILKAADIARVGLAPGQSILFLSFARATVSRVLEAIQFEQQIPRELQIRIEVDTYHSFFWRILKTHGYLIGLPRTMTILTPPDTSIALADIRADYGRKLTEEQKGERKDRELAERVRLAMEEGRVCFDLFADYAADILSGSQRVRQLLATRYPLIILDEFQDTSAGQWRVVQELGKHIALHALADPEQRIYGWIGADPERLNHFSAVFAPASIDLSDDNHRSAGTEIAMFGNDVLKGTFRKQSYVGVECITYPPFEGPAYTALVTETYKARSRLVAAGKPKWSLAILVPTKKLTQAVSDIFREPPAGMTEIRHTASVDMDAAILGAHVIAFLMQPDTDGRHFAIFIDLLCDYFQGKGGDEVAKGDLQTSKNLRNAFDDFIARQTIGKSIRGNSILVNILAVYKAARALTLSGVPDKDWLAIRRILKDGACDRLREIAQEVRNVRLLERGTILRTGLSEDWRENGAYRNALDIIRQAFLQEHFSTNSKPETGVVIMNMHKAKGKQFDEVIIFEGWPRRDKKKEIVTNLDRIVQWNLRSNIGEETRQNFRVSVTRAKQKTLVLTPSGDPCMLLRG
jgi:DNA helicase II / ATP-dependent DNA helicase PcrA